MIKDFEKQYKRKENEIKQMKIKIFRIIVFILLLVTLFTIFSFSSQNGTQSKGISTKVTDTILSLSNKYQQADTSEKSRIRTRTNAIVRKIAHFTIYTLLGILLMGTTTKTKLKEKWRILITLGLGIIYAILDEFHQSFSPGRTPKITDVYIDTFGILLGILLVLLIKKIHYKYISKRLETQ